MRKHRIKQPQSMERGQSLVEFAIGLVIILLLLAGLLDLGRIYFIYVALEDGAGEAALYLALNPACPHAHSGPGCADPNNAEYRARNAGGGEVNWTAANVLVDIPTLPDGTSVYTVGEPVSVTIEYSVQLLTPIIPKIAGINPIPLSVHASQVIIGE